MPRATNLVGIINQIYSMVRDFSLLEGRVRSLEHLANQQSILVDTLGDIMEELKKQEPLVSKSNMTSKKDT